MKHKLPRTVAHLAPVRLFALPPGSGLTERSLGDGQLPSSGPAGLACVRRLPCSSPLRSRHRRGQGPYCCSCVPQDNGHQGSFESPRGWHRPHRQHWQTSKQRGPSLFVKVNAMEGLTEKKTHSSSTVKYLGFTGARKTSSRQPSPAFVAPETQGPVLL